MRGDVAGLVSPHPLAEALPPVLQEDDLLVRMLSAFDDGLAPVLAVLDNLQAYVDPRHTPPDFLGWLGEWVGIGLRADWPPHQQRALLRAAGGLFAARGTAEGLRTHLELLGVQAEVQDSGGVAVSVTPGAALPGDRAARVRVRVRGAQEGQRDAVEDAVRTALPVHVRYDVEVLP